jgi:hypothetical protein
VALTRGGGVARRWASLVDVGTRDGVLEEWTGWLPGSLLESVGVARVSELLPYGLLCHHWGGLLSFFIEKIQTLTICSQEFLDPTTLRVYECWRDRV